MLVIISLPEGDTGGTAVLIDLSGRCRFEQPNNGWNGVRCRFTEPFGCRGTLQRAPTRVDDDDPMKMVWHYHKCVYPHILSDFTGPLPFPTYDFTIFI